MKSVHVATPKPDIIQDVFNEFVNISEHDSPALAFNVVHEYYPNTNITQIPNNATAFGHRRPGIIVLAFGVWAENTPERQVAAKEGANQILGLISQAEKRTDEKVHPGYGNYGAWTPGTRCHGGLTFIYTRRFRSCVGSGGGSSLESAIWGKLRKVEAAEE